MYKLLLITFLIIASSSYSQTFLDQFKEYKLQQVKSSKILDSLRKTKINEQLKLTRKKIAESKKQWITQIEKQIKQFELVFETYKMKTGFDFNLADSLLIVFQTDIQSNLNKFIIISANDTITYKEKWKMLGLHTYVREIVYESFLDTTKLKEFVIIDDRDSLLTLAVKGDFVTAKKLSDEHPCDDGSTSTLVIAKKNKNKYRIEDCFLRPFMFMPIIRKK